MCVLKCRLELNLCSFSFEGMCKKFSSIIYEFSTDEFLNVPIAVMTCVNIASLL